MARDNDNETVEELRKLTENNETVRSLLLRIQFRPHRRRTRYQ